MNIFVHFPTLKIYVQKYMLTKVTLSSELHWVEVLTAVFCPEGQLT